MRQALAAREHPVAIQKPEGRTPKPEPAAAKPLAADAREDRVEVSGRVVDAGDQPVAGAKLFLFPEGGGGNLDEYIELLTRKDLKPVVVEVCAAC